MSQGRTSEVSLWMSRTVSHFLGAPEEMVERRVVSDGAEGKRLEKALEWDWREDIGARGETM